jgi:predicted metal-dependent hydrolase
LTLAMHPLLQYTLDLFDVAPVTPAPKARPAPVKRKSSDKKSPTAHVSNEFLAPEFIATGPMQPAQPLGDALLPANFRHPRASRETRLGSAVVAYEFKRGKRRTIGFVVGPDGLVVSAPKWVPLYEVESALQEKAAWILRKLDETRERRVRQTGANITWQNGATFPFLGMQVQVALDPSHAFGGAGAALQPVPAAENDHATPRALHVALPHSATPEQIRDVVQAWLMREAKRLFTERLNHFAPQLQVQWRKLSLSNASTRWGSASADGSIRLNWRLIHTKPAVIDYVVVHELSHLRVMDHSPRFWDTVRTVVPDYAALRGQLKTEPVPKWA